MARYQLDRQGRLVAVSPRRRLRTAGVLLAVLLLCGGLAASYVYFSPFTASVPDEGIPTLAWKTLQTLDYATGQAPPELRAYVGQRVRVPGFLVLLDAVEDRLTEFLLVPVSGMCIHVPPPPPNLMVHVKDQAGIKGEEWMGNGVWLEGVLHIENVESEYGAAGFSLSEARLTPLRDNDPRQEASAAPDSEDEPIL